MPKKIRVTFRDGTFQEWIDDSRNPYEPSDKMIRHGAAIQIWVANSTGREVEILFLSVPEGPLQG